MSGFSVKERWVIEFASGRSWQPWLDYPINKPYRERHSRAPRLALEDAMTRVIKLRTAHPKLSFRLRHRTRKDIIMADIL